MESLLSVGGKDERRKAGPKRRPGAGTGGPRKAVEHPTTAVASVKGKSSGAPSKGQRRGVVLRVQEGPDDRLGPLASAFINVESHAITVALLASRELLIR